MTGVADLTSNTLAGIHSQLDSTVEVRSVRKPRVMDENPLQPYRERLAYAQDILWQLGNSFSCIIFVFRQRKMAFYSVWNIEYH